jgi:hypothetical protein
MTSLARVVHLATALGLVWLALGVGTAAQGRGGGQTAPPPTPQAAAPFDLTGYWVSVITEDWRWRMVTPARGDYASIPINQEAKNAADTWDPARDEASGDVCKAYGPPGLMRQPGRLRISWQDPNTLKVETDAGTQTRLLHFGAAPAPAAATRQGHSVARWPPAARGRGAGTPSPAQFGTLTVTTTGMLPGYLRKNGVPYSGATELTEHWSLFTTRTGDRWLVITSIVHDPMYLQDDWTTSLNFKREPDGSRWDPTPCTAQ